MNKHQIVHSLEAYSHEIGSMLPRFTKSQDGLHIDREDDHRFRDLVTEAVDLCQQYIPNSHHTAAVISTSYKVGISNWLQSSSYTSLKRVQEAIDTLVLTLKNT